MNCEQIRYELPLYLKNEATPDIQAQVEEHLDSCLPCVQEKKNLTEMLSLFKQIAWIEPSERFYGQMSEKFAVTFAEHPLDETEGNILENACFAVWDFFRYQVRHQPFWCLSTMAHAAIVLVLAMIFLNSQSSISQEELNYQVSLELPKISEQELATSATRNKDLRKPEEIEQALSTPFSQNIAFPTLLWLQKRLHPETKKQTLAFLEEQTSSLRDRIVMEGLQFLQSCQDADGSFRVESPSENRLHVSALALLVFLAEGNTHNHGEFQEVVRQGIRFLLRQQRISGQHKGLIDSSTPEQYLYHHSLATYVLLENYYLSGAKDSKLYEEFLKDALSYLLKYQIPDGGWSKSSTGKFSTLAVSSWPMTVLQLATPFHLPDQEEVVLPRARNFLKRLLRTNGTMANKTYETDEGVEMIARGAFCAQWLGQTFSADILQQQIQFIQKHQEQLEKQQSLGETLDFWYYGSLACSLYSQQQGELWSHWFKTLIPLVSRAQIQLGSNQGAVIVSLKTASLSEGAVYSTALSLLSLQTPYRY